MRCSTSPLVLLLLLLGCSGLSLGDPGDSEAPRCAQQRRVTISDPGQVQDGFDQTPNELLTPLGRTLTGTLRLHDGSSTPIRIAVALEASTLRAVYASDPWRTCEPWLEATVHMTIDAGDTLTGTTDGDLYVRDPYQIRGQWVPLSKLQTTLKPKFKGTVVGAPSVSASLGLNDDGSWSASLQLSAPVMLAACDPHEMCSRGRGGPDTDTEYQDLGEAVLHAAP